MSDSYIQVNYFFNLTAFNSLVITFKAYLRLFNIFLTLVGIISDVINIFKFYKN